MTQLTWFASGSSRPGLLTGYVNAGTPVGLDVMETSSRVRTMAAEYTWRGGSVFVDSGAFSAFRKGSAVDFDEVFRRYDELVRQSLPSNLYLVMPDRIADQAESYRLLVQYAPRIRAYADLGVKCLVPLQKGRKSLQDYWTASKELLGENLVAALPSCEAAVSEAEALAFAEAARPQAIHLLGLGQGTESKRARTAALQAFGATVSTDSVKHRSRVGKGRPITELRKALIQSGRAQGSEATTLAITMIELGQGLDQTRKAG